MTRQYGDGFKRPFDFFTGKPVGNPQANYGRYGQGTGRGRVEILPEDTPRPQDTRQDAKVCDVDDENRTVNYG